MRVPTEKSLVPLAKQFAIDMKFKILTNGKVSNRKKGLKNTTWDSLYALGLSLYRGGFIIRVAGKYRFINQWASRPYPYTIDAKIKAEALA